ncbi:MAG: glutamine synthetase family protein [Candidatus Bathyarchaeia archaeon]
MQRAFSFTEKESVAKFVSEKGIKILNLCHIPEDGRLKTLSFSAADRNRVLEILEFGERVDGSNIFSFIEPEKSDIYIKPNMQKAFINPFSNVPTLNILSDYLDEDGKPLDVAPKNVLKRAEERLLSSKGIRVKALAELEFYIIAQEKSDELFQGMPDKNYHESAPFSRFEDLRNEILVTLYYLGIDTKYAHSEVGRLTRKDGVLMEQHEVEFLPQSLEDMAENIAVAKWAIRNTCAKNGVSVSFSPKVSLEHSGNGMHIHFCAVKNGSNIIANPNGTLSEEGLKMIGGILKFSSSLTAFGNPTPISYLRFISRKESPMHICWSERNRLALIRIPLWWNFMATKAERENIRETIEYRAPDPLANAYLLLAGLTTAINYGLENPEEALKTAEKLHVEAKKWRKGLKTLPKSCYESAKNLKKDRKLYEANGVFPKKLINKTIEKLKAYKDKDLWTSIADKTEKIEKTIQQYIHYG